ncbi:MAG: DUF4058 family protein [bacterium]|nr:DUF4058 family protein [bacterium]
MAPVRSIRNQYRGINAHLHSLWQAEGGWNEFHMRYLADLVGMLRTVLIPRGYIAGLVPSLQIRRLGFAEKTDAPESDVTIFDAALSRAAQVRQPASPTTAEMIVSIPEALALDTLSSEEYNAINLYTFKPEKPERGEPIVWIELLSPSNKPGRSDAAAYQDKRRKIIENGIVFLEIDFLHESATTFFQFPIYRARKGKPVDANAHPYRIAIVEPRPDVYHGVVRSLEFDVDAPIPTARIPLSSDDVLDFDFGLPYKKTYEEMLYGLEYVDYGQLPLNFDRYSEVDQARIVARMLAVLKAAREGTDLEADAPLEAETLTLAQGLRALAAMGGVVS